MTLPERLNSEAELEDTLAEPVGGGRRRARRLDGDVLILGAGGKMGPRWPAASIAPPAHGQPPSRHGGVAIFLRTRARRPRSGGHPDDGVRSARARPDRRDCRAVPNVLFLAGRKFGTLDRTDVTWATNTVVPARVAEHFVQSRLVVFSTGNVYPLVPSGARLY